MKYYLRSHIPYQSDALTNPRAVVVELLHTVIAYRAVRATRWPIKHASVTVLDLHSYPVDDNVFNTWQAPRWSLVSPCVRTPFEVFWLWRVSIAWHYTWVSSRGQNKKNQILENITLLRDARKWSLLSCNVTM